MATEMRFCGRCGSPVAPGAPFCGRCGAPQAGIVAAPAAYAYPVAPSGSVRSFKLSHLVLAGGLVLVLLIAIVSVSAFTVNRLVSRHTPCTVNCGAKLVDPLTEPHTYRSMTYRFEVDYSSHWTVRSQSPTGISLGTRLGHIDINGRPARDSLESAINSTVDGLPSSTWANVQRLADIKGAHVGDQNGVGYLYSADYSGQNANSGKVRFAVIAATQNKVTVTVFAVNPEDTSTASGIPEAQVFDYLLAEFRWG